MYGVRGGGGGAGWVEVDPSHAAAKPEGRVLLGGSGGDHGAGLLAGVTAEGEGSAGGGEGQRVQVQGAQGRVEPETCALAHRCGSDLLSAEDAEQIRTGGARRVHVDVGRGGAGPAGGLLEA